MFRDILSSSRVIFIGLVFFVLVVGGSLLYSWHVHRTTDAELAETQRKVQPLKNDKEAHIIDNESSEIRSENILVDSPQPRDEEKTVSSSPVEIIDKDIRDEDTDTEMTEDKIVDEDTEMIEENNEYPEVPPDFPFSVVWQIPEEQRAQLPTTLFQELEVIGLVMVKLWNEGDHDFAGAFMENGRVYPTYPDVAYVRWEETEEPGARRISEVATADGTISEQILNGVIPSGIEIVDQDTAGIDPQVFLSP